MPIFMKFDGIEGTTSASRHPGGANFAMSDGSVKNISRSIGGGPHINVFSGSEIKGYGFGYAILVSRISVPNSPSDAIDALAPNAVTKARTLFEAQRSRVTTLGVVFSIPKNGANKMLHGNNLKQIGLASWGRISTVRFFITDNSNQTGVTVELEKCLITNYTVSGHGGNTHAGDVPSETLAINFVNIK